MNLTCTLVEGNLAPFICQSIDPNLLLVIPTIEIIAPLQNVIRICALIDSGASSSFISRDVVRSSGLPTYSESIPAVEYKLANGTSLLNHRSTRAGLRITGTLHQELLEFKQLPNAAFPVISGKTWLSRHDPIIHWRQGLLALTCLHQKKWDISCCTPVVEQVKHLITSCYPVVYEVESDYYYHQEGSSAPTNHTCVPPRPTNVASVSENRGVKRARYSSPLTSSSAYLDYAGTPSPVDKQVLRIMKYILTRRFLPSHLFPKLIAM